MRYSEVSLDEERRANIVVFFDGQNVLHTANEVFGFGRKPWVFDPLKLVEATKEPMEKHLREIGAASGVAIKQIRFYTGIPTFERDRYLRNYWERLFNVFRTNGIVVTPRDLRYYASGPPREKGIDLRIGLDIVRIATGGICDGILLFSQDSDLSEAIEETKALLARYSSGRRMHYFCAFPRNADPATNHGINRMHWLPLYAEDFEGSVYETPPKVDIEALLLSLERRHRKKLLRDFDLLTQGKRVTGCFRGCHPNGDDGAVLILEAKTDLLVMNVHPECAEMLGKFKDMEVAVIWTGGHKGRFEVDVRPLGP